MLSEDRRIWYFRVEGQSTINDALDHLNDLHKVTSKQIFSAIVNDWRGVDVHQYPGEMIELAKRISWKFSGDLQHVYLSDLRNSQRCAFLVKQLKLLEVKARWFDTWGGMVAAMDLDDIGPDPVGDDDDDVDFDVLEVG